VCDHQRNRASTLSRRIALLYLSVPALVAALSLPAEGTLAYRKSLTIDNALVTGPSDLVNFPVLLSVTLPPAHVTNAQGFDILFRAEDAATCGGASPCRLDHEIESFNSATGALVAWVRVPVLQTASDTVLFVYYGDASVTCRQANKAGVWDAGFRDVYHLNETGDHADSTANAFTAVTKGMVNQGVTGLFGVADDFVGPAESRLIASDGVQTGNSPFTYEVWFKMDTLQSQFIGLVTKGRDEQPGPNFDWTGLWVSDTNQPFLGWYFVTGGNLNGPSALLAGQWYYLAGTYDAGQLRTLYLNGVQVAADGPGATYADIPQYTRIGDDSNGQHLDGQIEEVRVSSSARSADWIQTTWNSLNSPGTFFKTIGPEDASPPPVTATCSSPTTLSACAGGGPSAGACNLRSIGTAVDYAVGTVTATNGSHVVTGAGGTTWLASNRGRGDRINVAGVDYTVGAVDSDTQLRLTVPYIGATGSGKAYTIARQFTTLQAWENCISLGGACPFFPVASANLVADNRSEVGIAYKDSSFTNGASIVLQFNGTTTDAAHTISLTADPGNRHNGIPGTGVLVTNGATNANVGIDIRDEYVSVEWLEVTGGQGAGSHGIQLGVTIAQPSHSVAAHNLIHNNLGLGIRYFTPDGVADIYDNFIYRNTRSGVEIDAATMNPGSRVRILNNTFLENGGNNAEILGSNLAAFPWVLARNNIMVDDGGAPDFNLLWPDVGSSHNITGDAAPLSGPFNADLGPNPRAGGIYAATVASVSFFNSTALSENLHIESGSTAVDAGATLTTIFADDIDGAGRVGPWDAGADDRTSPAPRGTGCPSGNMLGTNLVANGDFPIPPGSGGFIAGVPYAGDDLKPPDTQVSIQNGPKIYAPSSNQSSFSGDPSSGVSAATNWLYVNGNDTGAPYMFWQQQLGVSANTTYVFYLYASNVVAPGTLFLTDEPIIQFFRDGSTTNPFTPRGTQIGTSLTVANETSAEGDFWTRFHYVFTTGAAQTSTVLSLWDAATGFNGDDLAVTQIGLRVCQATTKVDLLTFTASPADSAVALSWTTGSELDNLGFHLYRSMNEEGPWERLTSSVIPGLGSSPAGASYRYRDTGLSNGTTYFYLLEDIETTGRTKRHGPVSATPRAEAGTVVPPEDESRSRMTYGAPEAGSLRVVSRAAGQVVLELTTEGFYAEPQEDGTVRIEIPGFVAADDELGLPVKRHWLEVVAGRKVEVLSVRPSRMESLELRPAGAEKTELVASRDGTQRLRHSAASKKLDLSRALLPEKDARIASIAFQGDVKNAQVEMAPVRWDGASGRLLLARTLLVTVVFRGREPSERVSRDGVRGRRERNKQRARSVVARLAARERGLYEVRFEELFGKRRRGFPASSLSLSRLGSPVAFHLEPASQTMGPGSRLLFWSEGGKANPYGTGAVYELELRSGGERMPRESAGPGETPAGRFQTSARFEEQRYYQAALVDAEDLWLWDMVLAPGAKTFSFPASGLAPSSMPSKLEVVLQGASDFPSSPDHHVRLYVNGSLAGEDQWNGKERRTLALEIPPGVLREAGNQLELENVGDTEAQYSMVFLDRFTLTYPRLALAEGGLLEGSWDQSGTAEVSPFTSNPIVVDVTPPEPGADDTPRWLDGARLLQNTLRFHVEAGRSYTVVDPASVLRADVRPASAPRWKLPTHRADYVAIGPRELLQTAKPLLDLRRRQGLEVASVPIDELFDEFGYGESRPEAIRDFLSYAYHHWQGGIRYVLLLGDASYDFKDYLGTHAQNLVPALPLRTTFLWTASDPALASVNGDDLLPDVAIGRLPAGDPLELAAMVQKLLDFETGASDLRGPVVLVTDNPDAAGDFDLDAKDLMSSVLASRPTRHISLAALGVADTRSAILEAFDLEDASSISYMGHGGIHLWASENLFDAGSVNLLAHRNHKPLVLTLDCLNGYFHFPYFDSLGEELLKAEDRGALAVIAPSGLSVNEPAHRLHKAILDELSNGRHSTLGQALAKAQQRFLHDTSFPELLAIYHLFGDPALSLR